MKPGEGNAVQQWLAMLEGWQFNQDTEDNYTASWGLRGFLGHNNKTIVFQTGLAILSIFMRRWTRVSWISIQTIVFTALIISTSLVNHFHSITESVVVLAPSRFEFCIHLCFSVFVLPFFSFLYFVSAILLLPLSGEFFVFCFCFSF